jgi:hypothetical protein
VDRVGHDVLPRRLARAGARRAAPQKRHGLAGALERPRSDFGHPVFEMAMILDAQAARLDADSFAVG